MSGIYVIQDAGGLERLPQTAYASEDLLQRLLADHPDLLAGDQIDRAAPREWLLISREVPLASEDGGAGRWAIDHVLLDQDAVPTLVEVKRSTNSQIRREVVGQMLDYAANAVVYWPVEQMRTQFARYCREVKKCDPDKVLRKFLGENRDPDEFWQQAKTNLQAEKIRLVFVADEIPTELQRIVEFLNGQMDPAQVLAVEVKQYVGQGQRVMVPRVLGLTAKAETAKPGRTHLPRQVWDEVRFFREFEAHNEPLATAAAARILAWGKEREKEDPGLAPQWGTGGVVGTFYPAFRCAGADRKVIAVSTDGKFEINFESLKQCPHFVNVSKRRELLEQLNQIGRVHITADHLDTWAQQPLAALVDAAGVQRLLETLDWVSGKLDD